MHVKLWCWLLLCLPSIASERKPVRPSHPDAGGVLRELTVASFGGSGQNTIRAIATDGGGNLFVAGTTSSPDLPVKDAAQGQFGDARVLRTTDLGSTWTPLPATPASVDLLVPDPADPGILFAVNSQGIYRTADGGNTWQLVNPAPASSLAISPGDHRLIAALLQKSGDLIRSTDGGLTWTPGARCSTTYCGGQLQADPNVPRNLMSVGFSGVLLSRDQGATFQSMSWPGGGNFITAAFVPSRPGWIYAVTGMGVSGNVSLSTDYGVTWTAKAAPPTIFSAIQNLLVDPDQPDTLVAVTADGLYKSTDDAGSWVRASGASGRFGVPNAWAIVGHRCSPAGGLFGAVSGIGSYGVGFSPDLGATWNPVRLSNVSGVVAGPQCAVYVTRDATTDAFVAKLAPDGSVLWTTYLGGSDQDTSVAITVDKSGNAWVAGNTSSPDFPSTMSRIGSVGTNGVFVTEFSPDGLIRFSTVLGGEANHFATALALDASGNAYVAGRTNSQKFPITPGVIVTAVDPESYTGFLAKLSPASGLVWATYLGSYYTFASALLVDSGGQPIVAGTGALPGTTPQSQQPMPDFLAKFDRGASRVVQSKILAGTGTSAGPVALAWGPRGELFVAGYPSYDGSFAATPGAYRTPSPMSGCTLYVSKLAAADWSTVFSSLVFGCNEAASMSVDAAGRVALGIPAGAGMPLRNAWLAGPTCSWTSSAVLELSADGSSLDLATYLDGCGSPGVAFAGDGSLYAGVAPNAGKAGILRVSIPPARPFAIEGIANAFSGAADAVVPGGIYTVTIAGLNAPSIDLGLRPVQPPGKELGGVRVTFDGQPATILQTRPGRVIAIAPQGPSWPHRDPQPGFASVQATANGVPSNPIWMPVQDRLPGLLTRDYLDSKPTADVFPDGLVFNEDGTSNDAAHPAPVGSTVTFYVTGLGVIAGVDPDRIASSPDQVASNPLYASWSRWDFHAPVPPVPVYLMPGFVSAVQQIRVKVEDWPGTDAGSGVKRVPFSLKRLIAPSSNIPALSNWVAVYVK